MNEGINVVVPSARLTVTFPAEANVGAQLTPGGIIMNDYRLTVSEIEHGKRLEVKRGAEVQNMDVLDGVGIIDISISEVK